jgi:hypothetical protein
MRSAGGQTHAQRPTQFSIKVSAKAGIGKTHLDFLDAQALAWRVDYLE